MEASQRAMSRVFAQSVFETGLLTKPKLNDLTKKLAINTHTHTLLPLPLPVQGYKKVLVSVTVLWLPRATMAKTLTRQSTDLWAFN